MFTRGARFLRCETYHACDGAYRLGPLLYWPLWQNALFFKMAKETCDVVLTLTIATTQKLAGVLVIPDKADIILHLFLLSQSVFASSLFKLRLWCIQSDRFDTVYVYGSWFCPWSASVDIGYHQCCWQERKSHLFLDTWSWKHCVCVCMFRHGWDVISRFILLFLPAAKWSLRSRWRWGLVLFLCETNQTFLLHVVFRRTNIIKHKHLTKTENIQLLLTVSYLLDKIVLIRAHMGFWAAGLHLLIWYFSPRRPPAPDLSPCDSVLFRPTWALL